MGVRSLWEVGYPKGGGEPGVMGVRSLREVGYPKGAGARSNGGEKPMGGGISKGGGSQE